MTNESYHGGDGESRGNFPNSGNDGGTGGDGHGQGAAGGAAPRKRRIGNAAIGSGFYKLMVEVEGFKYMLDRMAEEAGLEVLFYSQVSDAIVESALAQRRALKGFLSRILDSDDGRGFDPAAAQGQAGRWGLLGMAERAEASGGHLAVESAPGAGTRVTVRCEAR
jgi:hypothetical protein